MREIVWDQVLSVGSDEVDNDHKILVDLFNLLGHSVTEGAGDTYVSAVLEELINCTAWHFSHEERLMLENGFHELEAHKAEHKELVESVRELQDDYLESGKLEEKEFDFLERWLTEHILTSDMRFGTFLVESA